MLQNSNTPRVFIAATRQNDGKTTTSLGLLAALYVVWEGLSGGTPSGWASSMTTTLLVAGVQFLILGVLGEYVGRAFLSANGKPQGVVREMVAARDSERVS
jgi:undecaprenyl-phosphate 4-deoxy-4-formamido-L-arabinose transferase